MLAPFTARRVLAALGPDAEDTFEALRPGHRDLFGRPTTPALLWPIHRARGAQLWAKMWQLECPLQECE
jgi:hypothetical protein